MLLHGLNLRPRRMEAWRDALTGWGCGVAEVSFRGHARRGDPAWPAVTAADWLADVARARQAAAQRWPGAALSLCGYSLGALAGIVWALETDQPWRRGLLLAPAFRLRRPVQGLLAGLAAVLPGPVPVPSWGLPAYRLHDRTPVAAYAALLALVRRLRGALEAAGTGTPGALHFPQCLVYRPRDELVAAATLSRYAERLAPWARLRPLPPPPARRCPHHLMIDRATIGAERWAPLLAELRDWHRAAPPPGG